MYDDTSEDGRVVDCVFHGRVSVSNHCKEMGLVRCNVSSPFTMRIHGIHLRHEGGDVDGDRGPSSPHTWVLLGPDADALHGYMGWARSELTLRTETAYLVLTRYSDDRVSLFDHVTHRGRPPPTSAFTQDAFDALVGLHRRTGFVHWDFHHHNQLIRTDTVPAAWGIVDLDLATTDAHPRSRVFDLLPVDGFVRAARTWVRGEAAGRLTATVLGHAYDVVLLFSSHEYMRGGRPFRPVTRDARRVHRLYVLTRTILGAEGARGTGGNTGRAGPPATATTTATAATPGYGKFVRRLARRHLRRRLRITDRDRIERAVADMRRHLRLLCKAAILAALYTLNEEYEVVCRLFRAHCVREGGGGSSSSSSSSSSS